MSPVTFIRNPELWLEVIQRHGADATHAPAFAYELLAKRVQASGNRYDLSTVTTADCGGEPITPATLQAMRIVGFPPTAVQCAYGLAECLLFVCNSRRNVMDDDGTAQQVSSGTLAFSKGMGYDVVVANAKTLTVVADGEVGDIYVRSQAVIPGYYRRPELSADVFDVTLHANTPSPTESRGWYHTRDIGFIQNGELYVSGRRSDMIIVAGRNIFPQDLERSAEAALPNVREACCTSRDNY